MSLTSRDVLLMIRARDYASREIRNVGGAFGALGKAIQAVDTQLQTKLNRSMANQNRMIQQNQEAATRYAKTINDSITKSFAREEAAIGKSSAAYRTHQRNLENNAHLSKLVTQSHKDYARTLQDDVTAATRAHTTATKANNDALRVDTERNRAAYNQLKERNQVIRENLTTMQAGLFSRKNAIKVAKDYTNQLERQSDATSRYTKGLSKQAAQQVRTNSESHQAYLRARRYSDALEQGRITQRQYASRIGDMWRAESARNAKAMGDLQRELDARKEFHAADKRLIDQTKNARVNAANDAKTASERATQDRIAALGRERQAEVDRHNAYVKQVQDREARNRNMLKEAGRRYGEESRQHQAALKRMGAAERARYEEQAQLQRAALQRQQLIAARLLGIGIAATIAGAALTSFGRKGVASLSSMATEAMSFRYGMALAMTQIQNDTPATIEGLVRIGQIVGTDIPAAMDTMGSTMFFIFSSLRADVPTAQKLLEGFAKEAVAGNTNIEAAARSTIAILNGMNLEFQDLQRVQDFQFQTVRRGVITYEQLSANIGKLIPALARAGQEIETGGAMLAFLTRQGLSAEMATTAASRALELIAHPRVITRMEDLGIAIRDQRGEFLPLIDILSAMNDEIGHMTAPGRAQAMWDIFGGAGYRIQARRFFDTVFTNFDRFTWHVEQQQNNAGAMRRAYEIMFNEPQNQIQLFRNQLEVFRMELGERLIPVVMRLVEAGQALMQWFRDLSEETKTAVVRFLALSSAAMAITGIMLIVIGTITLMVGIVSQLGIAWQTALKFILGTPVALMAVVGALIYLAYNWEAVSEAIRTAVEWFNTAEGRLAAITTAIALFTVAYMSGFKPLLVVTGTLTTKMLALKTGTLATAGAMKAFALTPMGAILATLGAIVGVVYLMNKEVRDNRKFVSDMVAAQSRYNDEIDQSVDNFVNYTRNIGRARAELMKTRIEQEGLTSSIHDAGLSQQRFLEISASGIADQERFIRRTQSRIDAINAMSHTERTQQHYSERAALITVRNEMQRNLQASRENLEQVQAELRARGGLGELMADYLGMHDKSNDATRLEAARRREAIKVLIEQLDSMGLMNDELHQAAIALGIVDEETGELTENLIEASQAAQEFGNVLGNLTSISTAWSDALSKVNEGLEEPLESLREHDDALQLWMASMSDGRDTTRDMFTDMTTIIRNNSDLMTEDLTSVIGAVLAMGDAGPDAMAVLATADPDEFLEILRAIRLNAALTSEVVRDHIDEMLDGVHSLIDNYGEDVNNSWNDILEAVILTTDRYGEVVTGHIESMMQAVAEYIEQGGELSIDEMQIVMERVAFTAEKYGNLTNEEISSMMSLMLSYVANGGDIMGENFEAAMSAMWIIAQNGGEITVRELAEALGVGIEQAKEIGKDIGIEFTAATRDHLDPEGAAEYWRTQLGNQSDSLNAHARTMGVGIAESFGFGLQSVTPKMPAIQPPAVPRAQYNSMGHIVGFRNKGGIIPGRGPDEDTVLAMLTRGEYVLRRSAVDALGVDFLDNLNNFNTGGSVGISDWPTSSGGTFTAGGADLDNWANRFVDKYEHILSTATQTNIAATRDMIGAIGAMRVQNQAQHELANAERRIVSLNNEYITLNDQIERTYLHLNRAMEEAQRVTAQQELNIISATQALRDAEHAYGRFFNGMAAMDQELAELRQEQRVEELTQQYKELQGAVQGSEADIAAAQARVTAARLDMATVQAVAPGIEDEVQALLMTFKAQKELADALQALQEAEEGAGQTAATARELRIAEIELAQGTEELNKIRKDAKYFSEEQRIAELQLQIARENLTQAELDSTAPTQEVIDLQNELAELQKRQAEITDELRDAKHNLADAELAAMQAMLGVVDAGHQLAMHGPEQLEFFIDLAYHVGVATDSVRQLTEAMGTISGVKPEVMEAHAHRKRDTSALEAGLPEVMKLIKEMFKNRRVTIATDDETEHARLRRLALEVIGGEGRTLDEIRTAIDRIRNAGIGVYDRGGILPPGLTLAFNKTGQNEYVFRKDQLPSGDTITIEKGAVELNFNGPIDSANMQDVQDYVDKTFEEIIDRIRSD